MHYNNDMNTMNKENVFLSYSYLDSFTANVLANELRNQGISVGFLDSEMKSKEKFVDSIKEAIESSDFIVVLITPDSVKRDNVMAEAGAAVAFGKRILGVVSGMSIEDVLVSNIPSFLKDMPLVSIDDITGLKEAISHS